MNREERMAKEFENSIIKCAVIDFLIEEIMLKDEYEKLSYWDKTAVSKLVGKKLYLFGRVTA
tara:strand:+ start:1289 stop:1474 length:186 start_codon:yes stop_codon:yes gene_type:complete